MIVTEAEAKTKWCPQGMRLAERGGNIASYNRSDTQPEPLCKGSACMWFRPHQTQGPSDQRFYCGAAGKP